MISKKQWSFILCKTKALMARNCESIMLLFSKLETMWMQMYNGLFSNETIVSKFKKLKKNKWRISFQVNLLIIQVIALKIIEWVIMFYDDFC